MKLYLIVRSDLPLGQQAVQAAHALREFSERYPEEDCRWYKQSNTLALLAGTNEAALRALLEEARWQAIPAASFHEPDRNNELTAIALGPTAKKLCRNLPLAFDAPGGSGQNPRFI